MFERFTNQARRALVLGQEEARRLEHDYFGPEHLLLGLIQEGGSTAFDALSAWGNSPEEIRQRVESTAGRGVQAPDGHIPFTPETKKALEYSLREALPLGHNYIGTEHILLGLIREGTSIAAHVLTEFGVDRNRTLEHIRPVPAERAWRRMADAEAASPGWDDYTYYATFALAFAQGGAGNHGHDTVRPEHLLLGLVCDTWPVTVRDGGCAAEVFKTLGIDATAICTAAEESLISEGPRAHDTPLPYAPEAIAILDCAQAAARDLGHGHVGTEHLLLGLLREGGGTVARILHDHGVELDAVVRTIAELPSRDDIVAPGEPGTDDPPPAHRPPALIDDHGQPVSPMQAAAILVQLAR